MTVHWRLFLVSGSSFSIYVFHAVIEVWQTDSIFHFDGTPIYACLSIVNLFFFGNVVPKIYAPLTILNSQLKYQNGFTVFIFVFVT